MIDLTLKHCVYKTTHPLGFYYIGKGLTKRVSEGKYKGSGYKLKCAMAYKYPYEEWTSEILNTFEDEKSAYALEKELVTFEIIADPYCMNLQIGGRGGYKWTSGLARGLKISAAQKGKVRGPQKKSTIEKRTKSLLTEEVQEKIKTTKIKNGTYKKSHIWTDEQKEKKSIQAKNNPNYKYSEERKEQSRQRIFNFDESKKQSIRKKISDGVILSFTEEVRKKISDANIGKTWWHDPESKKQIFDFAENIPNNYIKGRCDGSGWNKSVNNKPRPAEQNKRVGLALKNKPQEEKQRLIDCRMKEVRGKKWFNNPITNEKLFIFPINIPEGFVLGRGKIKLK